MQTPTKSSNPLVRPLGAIFITLILAMGGITAYSFHSALQCVVGNKYGAECTFSPRSATRKKWSKRNKIL